MLNGASTHNAIIIYCRAGKKRDGQTPDRFWSPLRLAHEQIERPATPDVTSFPSAVPDDFSAVAARVFEGISQDRQPIEALLVVDGSGQSRDVRRQPAR